MGKKEKKRRGDRRDAWRVRDLDPLHVLSPYLFPERCNNEAYISERIDMTAISSLLEKKNAENPEYPYTMFHFIAAALVKTLVLRPKMNYYIKNNTLYQRKKITLSFVVKKQFADEAREALAFIAFPEDSTLESVHERIMAEIHSCRSAKEDNSSKYLGIMAKLPKFIVKPLFALFRHMDKTDRIPWDLVKTDPNYATVLISNLGSIKLKAGYHHLTNWGTTSLFVVIGERSFQPVFKEDGTYEMHDCLDLTITLDERIADGYYYSKTIRLLKHLLQNPELLEEPANKEIEY